MACQNDDACRVYMSYHPSEGKNAGRFADGEREMHAISFKHVMNRL